MSSNPLHDTKGLGTGWAAEAHPGARQEGHSTTSGFTENTSVALIVLRMLRGVWMPTKLQLSTA